MTTGKTNLDVIANEECPTCKAEKGKLCNTEDGTLHLKRIQSWLSKNWRGEHSANSEGNN